MQLDRIDGVSGVRFYEYLPGRSHCVGYRCGLNLLVNIAIVSVEHCMILFGGSFREFSCSFFGFGNNRLWGFLFR